MVLSAVDFLIAFGLLVEGHGFIERATSIAEMLADIIGVASFACYTTWSGFCNAFLWMAQIGHAGIGIIRGAMALWHATPVWLRGVAEPTLTAAELAATGPLAPVKVALGQVVRNVVSGLMNMGLSAIYSYLKVLYAGKNEPWQWCAKNDCSAAGPMPNPIVQVPD